MVRGGGGDHEPEKRGGRKRTRDQKIMEMCVVFATDLAAATVRGRRPAGRHARPENISRTRNTCSRRALPSIFLPRPAESGMFRTYDAALRPGSGTPSPRIALCISFFT